MSHNIHGGESSLGLSCQEEHCDKYFKFFSAVDILDGTYKVQQISEEMVHYFKCACLSNNNATSELLSVSLGLYLQILNNTGHECKNENKNYFARITTRAIKRIYFNDYLQAYCLCRSTL